MTFHLLRPKRIGPYLAVATGTIFRFIRNRNLFRFKKINLNFQVSIDFQGLNNRKSFQYSSTDNPMDNFRKFWKQCRESQKQFILL